MTHDEVVSRLYLDESVADGFAKQAEKVYFDSHEPQCELVENALVLPAKKFIDDDGKAFFRGGVVNADGAFVARSSHVRNTHDGALLEAYDYPGNAAYDDREVLYGGVLMHHFGHFLLETTNRLWYWIENRDKNLDIVFLRLKHSKTVLPQFWEFMDLVGIPREKIRFLNEPTRFSRVYVPEASGVINTSFNEKFLIPFQEVARNVVAKDKKKIYLSRTKFTKGSFCLGEKNIEKVFRLNGYHIVYPESLSLYDQVAYMKGADEVVGVIGTATHLELFAAAGIKSVILERCDVPLTAQALIHQAVSADWYDIGTEMNPFPVDHSTGPLLIGVTENFARYGAEHGLNVPAELIGYVKKSDSKAWVKDYFRRYSQNVYNERLSVIAPLIAKRLRAMSAAFIPFKRFLKQKLKTLGKRRNVL